MSCVQTAEKDYLCTKYASMCVAPSPPVSIHRRKLTAAAPAGAAKMHLTSFVSKKPAPILGRNKGSQALPLHLITKTCLKKPLWWPFFGAFKLATMPADAAEDVYLGFPVRNRGPHGQA